MEDLIDLIATDASASEISDGIKNILYAKAAEKVNEMRPDIASVLFNTDENSEEEYSEDQE